MNMNKYNIFFLSNDEDKPGLIIVQYYACSFGEAECRAREDHPGLTIGKIVLKED